MNDALGRDSFLDRCSTDVGRRKEPKVVRGQRGALELELE